MLRLESVSLQTGQCAKTHIHNCLRLHIVQTEAFCQTVFRFLYRRRGADDTYHLINMINGNQKTLDNVITLLCLVQIILCSSGDHVLLMLQVVGQHVLKTKDLRLSVDQRQHNDTEGILHLRMLEQLIQNNIRIDIMPKLNDNPHSVAVRLIPKIRNAFDLLILDKIRNVLNQICLIDKIRKLRHNNAVLAVLHGLDVRDRTGNDLALSGHVRFACPLQTHNDAACREVRSLDDIKQLFNVGIPVLLNPVINHFCAGCNHLAQIVRRNVGCHTYRNSCRSVYQKVRKACRKNSRLLLCSIEVVCEINGVLIDIGHHFRRYLRQSCFGISHCCSTVAVHRAKVSVSVNQAVAHGPWLSHINESSVNRAVSMRMVLTHCIADDTRTFTMRLVRSIAQLAHCPENSSLNRLHSVPDIR